MAPDRPPLTPIAPTTMTAASSRARARATGSGPPARERTRLPMTSLSPLDPMSCDPMPDDPMPDDPEGVEPDAVNPSALPREALDPDPNDLLLLLQRMQAGDAAARARVFERVYDELRATANAIMGGRVSGTFQPSDLVSGAYLKLMAAGKPWESHKHFMDVAADAMLQVLIDHVRERRAKKRGGGQRRHDVDDALDAVVRSLEERGIAMLDLYAAIERLEQEKPEWARFAKLRLFAGLDVRRVCEVMGLTLRTGEREWEAARAMLKAWLRGWEAA